MQLYTINTGYFKLDGGAMFGVVPKVLWSKTNPADDKNLCPWAMRSLLIEDGKRLILIDNVLWSGRVADTEVQDNRTTKIRALNEKLHQDERINLSLIPIADGLTLAHKK